MLGDLNSKKHIEKKEYTLEGVGSGLPPTANFDLDLDTAIYFLLTALIVDPELNYVTVFDSERSGGSTRGRKANVI